MSSYDAIAQQAQDYEQAIIVLLLEHHTALDDCLDVGLKPEHFLNPANRAIYQEMLRKTHEGIQPSLIHLAKMFPNVDWWAGYLQQLRECALLTRSSDCKGYAEALRYHALRAKLIKKTEVMVDELLYGEWCDSEAELLEKVDIWLEDSLNETRKRFSGNLKTVTDAAEDYWQDLFAEKKPCIQTGIASLDSILGGLAPGDLTIVAGRPGMGKSAFAATLCRNITNQNGTVAYYSMEMTSNQVIQRFISMMTGISVDRQRRNQLEVADYERIREALDNLKQKKIVLNDSARLSVGNLRSQLIKMLRKETVDCVLIDYLGLMETPSAENRNNAISAVTRELKTIAIDLQLPVVLFSQLNRAVESRNDKRPLLSDLRDSGSIEQDADQVLLLYRDSYYASAEEPKADDYKTSELYRQAFSAWQDRVDNSLGKAEIAVAKYRHGPTGIAHVAFDGLRSSFS